MKTKDKMKMCNQRGYGDRLSHIDNNHANEILEKKSVIKSSLTYWEMQVVFEIVVLRILKIFKANKGAW
ncbi:hypothetical protein, partial [Chitinophaga eiseniae]|uniref:hypothetical protein n=1 Tax=Chitinophaga eiseniae TaxID=634771 RepID=UPI001B3B2421